MGIEVREDMKLNYRKIIAILLVIVLGITGWASQESEGAPMRGTSEWSEVTSEASGIYPEFYDQVGENVRNPNPKTLDYSEGSVSKFASETSTQGLFDITLEISGKSKMVNETTDIVIVLDNSNSMDTNRRDELSKAAITAMANELLDPVKNANGNIRLALVTYGTHVFDGREIMIDGTYADGTASGAFYHLKTHNFSHKSFTTNPRDITSKLPGYVPAEYDYPVQGGTFTQEAHRVAGDIMDTSTADNKIILTITDGTPTRSFKVAKVQIESGIVRYDGHNDRFQNDIGYLATEFEMPTFIEDYRRIVGNGSSYWLNTAYDITDFHKQYYAPVAGGAYHLVDDHGFATMSQAKLLQKKGYQMYTVGIEISDNLRDTFGHVYRGTSLNNLKNISSGPEYYYDVSDVRALTQTLSEIANTFTRSIPKGKVVDPMGEYLILVTGEDGVLNYEDYTLKASDGTILDGEGNILKDGEPAENSLLEGVVVSVDPQGALNITGLELGEKESVTLIYGVHLATEKEGFKGEFYYRANGRTTLNPDENDPETLRDFPIPSVKGPVLNIEIQKRWQYITGEAVEDEDEKPKMTFALFQKGASDEKKKMGDVELSSAVDWHHVFRGYPVFDNRGRDFSYTVEEQGHTTEVEVVYKDGEGNVINTGAIRSTNGEVIITNRIEKKRFPLRLLKCDGDHQPISANDGKPVEVRRAVFDLYATDPDQPEARPFKRVQTGDSVDDPLTPEDESAMVVVAVSTDDDPLKYFEVNTFYWIVEVKSPEGYGVLTKVRKIRLEKNLEGIYRWVDHTGEAPEEMADNILTVSNHKYPDLKILKVDRGNPDTALSGAVFELYEGSRDANGNLGDKGDAQPTGRRVTTSDGTGELPLGEGVFESIPDGIYWLKEETAPEGYRLLSDPYFGPYESKGGKLYRVLEGGDLEGIEEEKVVLENVKIAQYPATGGSGSMLFYGAGMVLVILSLMINTRQQLTKEEK